MATTTVSLNSTSEQPDDPHHAWYAEWKAAIDYMNGPACKGVEAIANVPEYGRVLDLEHLIGSTPARTLAGARDQLRVVRHWCTAGRSR